MIDSRTPNSDFCSETTQTDFQDAANGASGMPLGADFKINPAKRARLLSGSYQGQSCKVEETASEQNLNIE